MIPISKPDIGAEEKAAVFEVLDSGMIAMGPRTAQFEQAFAEMCGVKHAIAVASGSVPALTCCTKLEAEAVLTATCPPSSAVTASPPEL